MGRFVETQNISSDRYIVSASRARPRMRLALAPGISAVKQLAPRLLSKPSSRHAPTRAALRPFSVNAMSDDESALRALIDKLSTYTGALPDWGPVLLIRPSGNPITMDGLKEMMSNADITDSTGKLLEVKTLDVQRRMAYAVSVNEASFAYKGTPNHDVFVMSYVFKKADDAWQACTRTAAPGARPTRMRPVRGLEAADAQKHNRNNVIPLTCSRQNKPGIQQLLL